MSHFQTACRYGVVFALLVGFAVAEEKPLTPKQAASTMQLPEGFRVSVFAAEPDLVQPISFTTDDRGRLWVVQCLSYPYWTDDKDQQNNDSVVIFEDKDGDGVFDSRKVFLEGASCLTGIEVGFGGVWLTTAPNFLFIPDANRDDVPDGPAQILLDGFTLEAKHNVVNGLRWGPDGWLYGRHGITATSNIGKPGADESQRIKMNCGVWRYHPVRHQFEVVANGTTNPWGLDFNEYGAMFITNCVINHLFHITPGGHYKRMHGQDFNAHAYQLIAGCADHIHWGGGKWTESRGGGGIHDKPGGGHAHSGAMIYQGDNWPEVYRGNLFTLNLHGRRANQEHLHRKGAGYVAHHGEDFLFSQDPWFRGVEMKYGPDGGVYLSDWHDTGECHHYKDPQKATGRIYKITYGKPRHTNVDLWKLPQADLLALQGHKNEWFVRHARRILHERAAANKDADIIKRLEQRFAQAGSEVERLRELWLLHLHDGLGERGFGLEDEYEHVRAWAIRLELEDRRVNDAVLETLVAMARQDVSPVVRLALASGLQRLPVEQRWNIATELAGHAEDAEDANLPLMIWYGIEPAISQDRIQATKMLTRAKMPLLRQFIARRIAAGTKE